MTALRERAMSALLTLVARAYPWTTPPSRRLVTFDDCPKISRPQAFLFRDGADDYVWNDRQAVLPKREMALKIVVYIDATPPNDIGATQIDNILDALDAAFAGAVEPSTGRNTLGGIVNNCRLDGPTGVTPGDIDNDGLIWARVKIILP